MSGDFQWSSVAFGGEYYNVVDLGTLGGTRSAAWAINNNGQVTGFAETADGRQHAIFYTGGAIYDIGAWSPGWSAGWAINDRGDVVGYIQTEHSGVLANSSFLYSQGVMNLLALTSNAYGINSFGTIVGDYFPGYPAVFVGNGAAPFGPPGYAVAINDKNEIVGGLTDGTPFLFREGVLHNLGSLNGGPGRAWDINNLGQVVGESGGSAFLYSDGVMQNIGSGVAYGINEQGMIVGATGAQNAFLYVSGILHDLNDLIDPDSGWNLLVAHGINNRGQIAGIGINSIGEEHGFMLTFEDVDPLPPTFPLPGDPIPPGADWLPPIDFPEEFPDEFQNGSVPETSTAITAALIVLLTFVSRRRKR